MVHKILILPEAKLDILEGRKYYSSILKSLGKRFREDIKSTIAVIKKRPLTFGYRFEFFRTANLGVFPYQVHYLINDEDGSIIIFAVLHAHRNPDFIQSRLKQ